MSYSENFLGSPWKKQIKMLQDFMEVTFASSPAMLNAEDFSQEEVIAWLVNFRENLWKLPVEGAEAADYFKKLSMFIP